MRNFEKKIHSSTNSNFNPSDLDWVTRIWIYDLCQLIDEELYPSRSDKNEEKSAFQKWKDSLPIQYGYTDKTVWNAAIDAVFFECGDLYGCENSDKILAFISKVESLKETI